LKVKAVYVCQECGASSPKWQGKCTSCGAWNSFVLEEPEPLAATLATSPTEGAQPLTLDEVDLVSVKRLLTGISELDGVVGGGLVPGSVLLLGGEPGIGKSTLLLQMALALSRAGESVMYVCGEESAAQVRMRAKRLGAAGDQFWLLAENNVKAILYQAAQKNAAFLIVDSIQTVFLPELSPSPGSVSQVRHCGAAILQFAKENNVTALLVGHVTKEGALAGPRVLEHMVDAVLYFEGERLGQLRLLRAVKNRFGSTNEIGVFEMTERGLLPLNDPSGIFLAERSGEASGAVVGCVMQGTRPVLLEVQALTSPTTFGNPRRLAYGIDYNRLLIIIAVLEKRAGFNLAAQDIYVNVTGGIRVDDPAIDLAVASAIASAYRDRPLPAGLLCAGEIGLTGEVRHLGQGARRLSEAAKFNFDTVLMPVDTQIKKEAAAKKLQILPAKNVKQALAAIGLN